MRSYKYANIYDIRLKKRKTEISLNNEGKEKRRKKRKKEKEEKKKKKVGIKKKHENCIDDTKQCKV